MLKSLDTVILWVREIKTMEYFEIPDGKITKRQHYVPRAYLKNFSFDQQNPPHVYVVFSNGKESQPVSIEKICCQSYLYDQIAVDSDSGAHIFIAPNEIEHIFSKNESKYADIISKLTDDLQEKNDFELTVEEIKILQGFMSSLLWRNPNFVHISNCVVDKLFAQDPEFIRNIQNAVPDVPPNVAISYAANEFLKEFLFLSTLAMAKTMEDSRFCIFRTSDSVFVTSDMPVVNIYGEEQGIHYDLVGMPITPELFVAFIDAECDIPKVLPIDSRIVRRINSRQQKPKSTLISNRKELLSYIDSSYDYEEDDDEEQFMQLLEPDKETILKEYREIMDSERIKYWK